MLSQEAQVVSCGCVMNAMGYRQDIDSYVFYSAMWLAGAIYRASATLFNSAMDVGDGGRDISSPYTVCATHRYLSINRTKQDHPSLQKTMSNFRFSVFCRYKKSKKSGV